MVLIKPNDGRSSVVLSDRFEGLPNDAWDRALRVSIVVALVVLTYATLSGHVVQPMLEAMSNHEWGRFVQRPSWLWLSMGTILLCFRTLLWFRYKAFVPATPEEAPMLTVIIPAYNEGMMVERSIHSVLAAAYPRERLEVFVVDDGSSDDTWEYISRAASRHEGIVTTVRFAENRGKRAALAEGFRRARGEVVVTIDSDSVIDQGTLLAMVAPFKKARIGAVAGRVEAYNRHEGLIPRMLHVRFILSFDFLRAVQSTYGTVYCCPGALAAYRTSVVRKVLDAWEGQTFLGTPCTYGEDRALTNFILADGYDAVYQRNAVVRTIVPVTYDKLCKMYLRWDRSYVREELKFLTGVLWKRPLAARMVSFVDTFVTNLRYPVIYASLGLLVVMVWSDPWIAARLFVVMGAMSGLSMLYYLRSERSWDFVYGILYAYFAFLTLFWIFPYAMLTVRSRSWLTR